MKLGPDAFISLALLLAFVLGGLWLVPVVMGSDATPWPQLGVLAGYIAFRIVWAWYKARQTPPPG